MSAPQPLVLLPGQLCDDRLWRDPAAALADVARPILADLTQDDSVEAMAAGVLAAAPAEFALAGLSMGSYVAFEMLRRAPSRVTRLALLDTTAAPDSPERAVRRESAMKAARLGRFAGITPRLLPQFVHARHVGGPVGAEVMAMTQRVGRDAFLRQQRAILNRPDSRPLLPDIRVPTLIGVGDADRQTPPATAEAMVRTIPNAKLHVFAACGHLPPMESPEECARVLRDWLAWR